MLRLHQHQDQPSQIYVDDMKDLKHYQYAMQRYMDPHQPTTSADETNLYQNIDVDVVKGDLPIGWRVENGFLTLNEPQDDWHLEGNYLVRRHYVPRLGSFKPTEANCPVPLHCLDKKRITKMNDRTIIRDNWNTEKNKAKYQRHYWTGETRFKLKCAWRTESRRCFLAANLNAHERSIGRSLEVLRIFQNAT